MFSITNGTGFQMEFENGWTISIQWGPTTYHSKELVVQDSVFYSSPNAEMAIFRKGVHLPMHVPANSDWKGNVQEHVWGWIYPDDVPQWMEYVKNLPNSDKVESMEEWISRMQRLLNGGE